MLDAREYLNWLRRLDQFELAIRRVDHRGRLERSSSRPWRLFGAAHLADHAAAWAKDYRTSIDTIAKVLPPAMRANGDVVEVLALSLEAPIVVGPSCRISDPARISRLKVLVASHLDHANGDRVLPLDRGQRAFMQRALLCIDPSSVDLAVDVQPGLRDGQPAAFHATAAGVGSWIAGPSAVDWPIHGTRSDNQVTFAL